MGYLAPLGCVCKMSYELFLGSSTWSNGDVSSSRQDSRHRDLAYLGRFRERFRESNLVGVGLGSTFFFFGYLGRFRRRDYNDLYKYQHRDVRVRSCF